MTGNIKQAVEILKKGGLVCFPTETVYGLGAALFNERAIRKIYKVKGRARNNPLIVHIADAQQLETLVGKISQDVQKLIKKFWPGPLTIVCKRKAVVPSQVSAGLNTVAVRMPKNPVARKLIRMLGEPIAAPSANRSGRPSPTRYADVVKELGDQVDLVLNEKPSRLGLESTVVDTTRIPFQILRPGFVTLEDLKKVVPHVQPPSAKLNPKVFRSPGVGHPHYQPSFPVVLVRSKVWKKTLSKWKNKKLRLGVFSYRKEIPAYSSIVYSRKFFGDKVEYARNLYSNFFEAEEAGVEMLLAESVDKKGVGLALMDRLSRASL